MSDIALLEKVKIWIETEKDEEMLTFLEENLQEDAEKYLYLSLAYFMNEDIQNAHYMWINFVLLMAEQAGGFQVNGLVNNLKYLAKNSYKNQKYLKVLKICDIALQIEPDNAEILIILAKSYVNLEHYEKAEETLNIVLQSNQLSCEFYEILGFIQEYKKDYKAAKYSYHCALKKNPKSLNSYKRLLLIEQCYGSFQATLEILLQALENFPHHLFLHQALAILYKNIGAIDLANESINKALQLYPNNMTLLYTKQTLLPVIYLNEQEISDYRNSFIENIKTLTEIKPESTEIINEIFDSICSYTNFLLHYQGQNDKEIQKKYGEFVQKIISQKYSITPATKQKSTNKIRIGYLSPSFRKGIVPILFLNWLKYANRKKFEIYCYFLNYSSQPKDEITQEFENYSDYFYIFTNLEIHKQYQKIIESELDILVFLDIGMEPMIMPFAAIRLAPIQCATWGHPITSGIPTIDYFLSNDAMEPEDADQHYTEKLIRLPRLGVCFSPPNIQQLINTKKRQDYGIKKEEIIYISCQNLRKYLPQYDYIYAEIVNRLQGRGQGKIIFIKRATDGLKVWNNFRDRLSINFGKRSLDVDQHCIFLPPLDIGDYFGLLTLGNVFLDTFDWSGGITSLDALLLGLPIVTLPKALMRSRQSYGMLKVIGVTETIAKSEQDYIELAVKLGENNVFRNQIIDKIKKNSSKLIHDIEIIKELENFYETVVANHS